MMNEVRDTAERCENCAHMHIMKQFVPDDGEGRFEYKNVCTLWLDSDYFQEPTVMAVERDDRCECFKYVADLSKCGNCKHSDKDPWDKPCIDCKRNSKDLWVIK